jgi:DNA end-binding protein Ku
MLHTMYYKDEVREAPDFGTEHASLKEGEVKVAHQLIAALAAEWDPAKYYDTFEENLKKLIKARMEGKEVVPIAKAKPSAAPTDLMAALKQSLAQMEGKKKGPQRVEAAQKASEVELRGKAKAVGNRKRPPQRAA